MSIDTSAIAQNSRQMFAVLQNAQQKTTELSNNIAKLSIAEKVSTPAQPVALEMGTGQSVDLTV